MLFYAVTKFVAYGLWCLIGLRWLAPSHATLLQAARYGALRWLLGLGFGLLAAIALGSVSRESLATLYLSVYSPLRLVEWSIMAVLMRRVTTSDATPRGARVWLWVGGGVVVSFVSDLASPEGMAGRFCVGRCLC